MSREFLRSRKNDALTPCAVAAALNVRAPGSERIARDEKPVTADTVLGLGKFFKTGAAFWMNIQARFDLETAEDALARADQEDRVLRGVTTRGCGQPANAIVKCSVTQLQKGTRQLYANVEQNLALAAHAEAWEWKEA